MKSYPSAIILMSLLGLVTLPAEAEDPLTISLRFQTPSDSGEQHVIKTREESWLPSETAIIVCDAWDLHHCLNAVRRLEEFAPRLNEVLVEARDRGVTIIHAPSDCMDAYRDHPARQRAMATAKADKLPDQIESWCSKIPAEENAVYPIDQSDGGEDDDPEEHAEWAAKLKSMGRNPAAPWKKQTDLLTIDPKLDFISDRGEEVWSILQHRGIDNVILTGVHTNMCVLGRPFGLRNLARNGKNVVLMRDMTDTMYNPKRWPYVSHFEGTRRIVSHIEKYVCPTITSDQFIGGKPFRFSADQTSDQAPATQDSGIRRLRRHWNTVWVPHQPDKRLAKSADESLWYRCVIRIDSSLDDKVTLNVPDSFRGSQSDATQIWFNGNPVPVTGRKVEIPERCIERGEANLLVIRWGADRADGMKAAPTVQSGTDSLLLSGHWQFRIGNQESLSSIPLPAKFGGSPDIVSTFPQPLWTPTAVNPAGKFTAGIEGPACDREGNVLAVNYGRQGTIGRIRPDGVGEVFVTLPEGSIGNGIRFAPDGSFFVADYTGHNVLRVDPDTREVAVHAHQELMNQPNDLAITPDGQTLFASDPNWTEGTGQLWRIDADGSVTRLAENMGTTNGVEVSPDGQTLYVNESKQRNVWAFTITEKGDLANKRLVRRFDDHGFDGMRCDVDGNLYITRHGKGTVVKMSPSGEILREIPVLGRRPSNLCFGGPDGRTVYVTEVDFRRLVSFRVDRPGRDH